MNLVDASMQYFEQKAKEDAACIGRITEKGAALWAIYLAGYWVAYFALWAFAKHFLPDWAVIRLIFSVLAFLFFLWIPLSVFVIHQRHKKNKNYQISVQDLTGTVPGHHLYFLAKYFFPEFVFSMQAPDVWGILRNLPLAKEPLTTNSLSRAFGGRIGPHRFAYGYLRAGVIRRVVSEGHVGIDVPEPLVQGHWLIFEGPVGNLPKKLRASVYREGDVSVIFVSERLRDEIVPGPVHTWREMFREFGTHTQVLKELRDALSVR